MSTEISLSPPLLSDGAAAPAAASRAALYSLAAYTTLSASQAAAVLSCYAQSAAETVSSYVELSGGLSNSNYALRTSAGRSFLCKVCDEKGVDAVLRQVRALLLLRARAALPIAFPVQRTDCAGKADDPAEYVLCMDGLKPIVLYDFLDGVPPARSSTAVMEALARAQAALHRVDGAAFAFLPPFPMGVAAMRPFLEEEIVSAREPHTAR